MAFVLGPGRSEPRGRDLWGPCGGRGVKDHCGLVPVSVWTELDELHADSLYGFGLSSERGANGNIKPQDQLGLNPNDLSLRSQSDFLLMKRLRVSLKKRNKQNII